MHVMKTYEVAFVIRGYVDNIDDDIGVIECNGTVPSDIDDEKFVIKDGRLYYTIKASSPQLAYEKAKIQFENEDLKQLHLTDWTLEHVSRNNQYWYKEDLPGIWFCGTTKK